MNEAQARRVALYLPSLAGGGAERVTVKLAHGLAERGVSVDLVLAKAEGPCLADIDPCIRVIDLGAPRVLRSLPGLVAYLRRERPQAMLSAIVHANIVAIWAKRLARVPTRLIVSDRTSWRTETPGTSQARLWPFLEKCFYPWADGIVAVSHGVAENLVRAARLPPEQIAVIYNPVVLPTMIHRAQEDLQHPWFRPNEPPVVLAVGRLTQQKDFPTLLRAFALLRKQVFARLLVLGEGKDRAHLECLVRAFGLQEDVSMPGFVDNPYAYMARSAVFVLSSAWEGLPGVLIEAMACGCPVVSTDCPSGPAEILEHGRLGRLVAVGDAEALAANIGLALRQGRGDATAVAQKRAMEFSVERATTAYYELLFSSPAERDGRTTTALKSDALGSGSKEREVCLHAE